MATITPVRSSIQPGIEKAFWETLRTVDTADGVLVMGTAGAFGAMQVTGTFGAATVTLQGSNDGSNYAAITDAAGNTVALAAAGIKEFSTAAAYIRPSASGGTGDDLDVTVILRG